LKISDLTPHQLDTLYGKSSSAGKSPRTIRNIHNVISAALNQGVRWGWIDKNPALRATLPEANPLRIESPSPEQARLLISTCQAMDDLLGAFVFLAAVTGCRRGEIAALPMKLVPGDVLIIGQVRTAVKGVTGIKSTKDWKRSSGPFRSISAGVFQYWQWSNAWSAQPNGAFIYTPESFVLSSQPDGSRFVNLDAVSRKVRKVADQLGMKSVHLHSLRHFAATELLAGGVSPMTQPKCWATQIRR